MRKTCAVSGQVFEITEEDLAFYKLMHLPPPTLCPQERLRRRIALRNFRNLYHRRCSATGKNIISMYDDHVPFPVFDREYWWGDGWDARAYGRRYDFGRSFFSQYADLDKTVPRYAINNLRSENCGYSNMTLESKDCYLIFGCVRDEHCLYGHIVWDSEYCFDTLYAYRCKWCSHSTDIVDCYELHYSTECTNCSQSYFLHDCRNCEHCFGGINLRNKKFCYFGEQLTREEYEARLANILPFNADALEKGRQWLGRMRREHAVYPEMFGARNEECTGNHVYDSKGMRMSFDAKACEDSAYCFTAFGQNRCYDMSFCGGQTSFCCENLTLANCNEVICSHLVLDSSDVAYSQFCYGSHDLFGCAGLRQAAYCILNVQYSREDYIALREKIVSRMQQSGEWGEFFPMADSPFAYNESIAAEYLPLSPQETAARGLRYKELEPKQWPSPSGVLPRTIKEASDDVLNGIFRCERTGKAYRITAQELDFYRRTGLPLPRLCPDARHEERMALRAPRAVAEYGCAKCGKRFTAAVPPAAGRGVYCEPCYLEAVGA